MRFNGRNFDRIDQLPELTVSAIYHNRDTVCVLEHRYHHSEEDIKYFNSSNGWTFVSASAWKNFVIPVIRGVGMLIGPPVLKLLNNIDKIQPKMMIVMFNDKAGTTIISSNNPTNASDETDVDAFYNELSSLVRSIPKHNVLIIGGYTNALLSKSLNNFNLHDSTNRNGNTWQTSD